MASETDEDVIVSTVMSGELLEMVEDRSESAMVSVDGPREDQEEGELSEKEEVCEEEKSAGHDTEADDAEVTGETSIVGSKVSLDDPSRWAIMASRGGDDYAQRSSTENVGTDEEKVWLRDKVAYRPAATSYTPNSNLYNFAWAQAVQGNRGFKLVEKQDGDGEAEELLDNGASFGEDDETENGLPETMVDLTLKIPEGYDMRQVLYDRRSMKKASWNSSRGDPRRAKNWIELDENTDSRRRFDKDERGGTRNSGTGRRKIRSPTRRRDSRAERVRRSEKDRLFETERLRARDRENGRERGNRNDNSLRSTSSDESDHSRRSAPSGANRRQSQSGDNAAEVREEGEIEEGEIELPNDNLRSRSSSQGKSEYPRADSPVKDGISSGDLKRTLSSRLDFRNSSSHIISLSRESSFRRLPDDDLRHRLTKDAEREKSREETMLREDRREQVAHLTALMKSVTVKDAQKAFINTCARLDNAARILKAFAQQRISSSVSPADHMPRDVSKMATKVFQGLRAVYVVWNTASGREQERDRDTFPRLLQFVTGSCLKFFSSKQARQLEEFMDHVTRMSRKNQMEGSSRQTQAAPKSVEPLQELGVRQRDMSAFASISNSKLAPCGTKFLEGNSEHGTDKKDVLAEAAIAAAALAYAQSSAAAFSNFSQGSNDHPTIDVGGWGWNGSNLSLEQSMSPGLPPGYSGISSTGRSLVAHGVAAQTSGSLYSDGVGAVPPYSTTNGWTNANKRLTYDVKSPYGPGFLEEDWEELSPPPSQTSYAFTTRKVVRLDERGFPISSSETISTVKPQNKVGIVPVSLNFRLASPTPSEDDDEPENQDTTTGAVNGQLGYKPPHLLPKLPSTMPPVSTPFYMASNSHIDDTGRVHYASVPTVPLIDQDSSLNFEQLKSQLVSGPVTSIPRSRDPRKQPRNGHTEVEIPLRQLTTQAECSWPPAMQAVVNKRVGENFASEAESSKRMKTSGSSNEMQNMDSTAGTFAMGGWLEEGFVMSPGHENHGVQSMDVDLDSPTPSDRKQNPVNVPAGTNFKKIVFPSASGSTEMLGSGPVTSIQNNPPPDPFGINSTKSEGQAGEEDIGKHRMRPRDPRRALLDSAADIVQVNQRSPPIIEAADSGTTLQIETGTSLPTNTSSDLVKQPSINSLENPLNLRDPRLSSNNSTQSNNATLAPEQPSTEQKNMTVEEEPVVDERNNARERESSRNQGIDAREVFSGESILDEVDHLHPWDPVLRKPRFGPSHWGGSNLHRDFEQLLEDLDEDQRITIQNERKRRIQEQDRMFSAGKLCLVLDLDHTLLNSAKFSEIEPEFEARLRQAENMERSRSTKDPNMKQELYRFPHMSMWTKLRPGIWKFLAKASELYELHVYTMGNKAYATEMAKLLDPTGILFSGRVISKGDEVDGSDKSKDLDGVLGMESAVVIIDDSSRVWPHHRENLIVVERYMYFPSSRRQFGLLGPSLLEVGHDERAVDGMLSSASGVIDRIHRNFFSNKKLREVDVRAILAAEQRRVLDGCRVLFSRIFPVGEANPHLHPLWRLAEQFGASCCLYINDKVTHVVAISLGTDKVNWATATGRPVVRPTWLEASAILYRRANEQDFPVPP
ncbi:uncharacterized protein [Physcomitrium patens]|uniref:uncharacterized protein isoform X2 n=1 Tax=Physcomitrium patens TaxID=3218 RepID=UPI000D177BA5|nr:uncharacterized protein LOC112273290 isoform X2 [Physcomitrium patens]|eukprot:XP_024357659.1 uncharacterized protein LOC112273290 isoform X2 [Physcomitrella patens]